MSITSDLIVPKEFLNSANISAKDLAIEIAVYLYEKKRLTLGQARRLADLDRISFQKELARRNVYIHLETEDVLQDIENLSQFETDMLSFADETENSPLHNGTYSREEIYFDRD